MSLQMGSERQQGGIRFMCLVAEGPSGGGSSAASSSSSSSSSSEESSRASGSAGGGEGSGREPGALALADAAEAARAAAVQGSGSDGTSASTRGDGGGSSEVVRTFITPAGARADRVDLGPLTGGIVNTLFPPAMRQNYGTSYTTGGLCGVVVIDTFGDFVPPRRTRMPNGTMRWVSGAVVLEGGGRGPIRLTDGWPASNSWERVAPCCCGGCCCAGPGLPAWTHASTPNVSLSFQHDATSSHPQGPAARPHRLPLQPGRRALHPPLRRRRAASARGACLVWGCVHKPRGGQRLAAATRQAHTSVPAAPAPCRPRTTSCLQAGGQLSSCLCFADAHVLFLASLLQAEQAAAEWGCRSVALHVDPTNTPAVQVCRGYVLALQTNGASTCAGGPAHRRRGWRHRELTIHPRPPSPTSPCLPPRLPAHRNPLIPLPCTADVPPSGVPPCLWTARVAAHLRRAAAGQRAGADGAPAARRAARAGAAPLAAAAGGAARGGSGGRAAAGGTMMWR